MTKGWNTGKVQDLETHNCKLIVRELEIDDWENKKKISIEIERDEADD